MNEIAFVIAPERLGGGPPTDAVEPVIDGRSLVEWIGLALDEVQYLGLRDVEHWLAAWRATADKPTEVTVLGCNCGNPECAEVTVLPEVTEDVVSWRSFTVSHAYDIDPTAIPAFSFDKAAFVRATDSPMRVDQPIRTLRDIDQLAAALPLDHEQWLRAMTLAYSRDFLFGHDWDFTDDENAEMKSVTIRGLQAFAESGKPMTAAAIRTWAHGRRYAEEPIERMIAWAKSVPGASIQG